MIICTLILIFGLLFALRIYFFNEQNRIFDNQTLMKTLLFIIFLTLWCCLFVVERFFLMWVIVFFSISAILVTIFVTAHSRERKFRQDFVDFLDRTILQVRSGQSFSNALELSNAKTPSTSRLKLEKIIESIHFSKKIETTNTFVEEIFIELGFIQQFPHKTLDRLNAFRRKIKIEDEFRRRSGRIVRQVRIQLLFLGIMYASVFVFVVSKFGFFENLKLILISLALFLLGIVGFFYFGAHKQWKI